MIASLSDSPLSTTVQWVLAGVVVVLALAVGAVLTILIIDWWQNRKLNLLQRASGRPVADTMKRWWPVIFRGGLYFLIAGMAVLIDKTTGWLSVDKWPTPQAWLIGGLAGTLAGLTAVRAYFDGSSSRHSDKLEKQDTMKWEKQKTE